MSDTMHEVLCEVHDQAWDALADIKPANAI